MTRFRKKKKKSHSSSDRTRVDSEVRQSEKKDKGKAREERAGSDEVIIKNVAPGEGRKMTDAERRFEETQRLRVCPFFFSRVLVSVLRALLILGVERREGEKDG